MMKIHGSERRRPRLRVSERWPYVRIGVLFRAFSVRVSRECLRSAWVGGMTLTLEPVSTRNCVFVCESRTKNRRLRGKPVAPVAASVRLIRFPSCRVPGISWQLRRTCCGTSTGCQSSAGTPAAGL